MAMNDHLGPFRVGPGGLPPYLAGRESERVTCRAFMGELQNGRPPPREIVFYGPRGNGKTALLVWLQKEAASYPEVDVIRLTPAAVRTETKLVEHLLSPSWWQRLAPETISVHGITWRPDEGHPPPLDEALATRAEKKPLVLVLDEAHTLDEEVGGALLNASQQVGRALPFLLVLAGTPDLQSHPGTMNATFWNRAERYPVGRLAPPAAAAALRKPLQSENIDIDEDAVAHMTRDSHGYPYFVQLWGETVWRQACMAATEARRRIARANVDAAQATFDRQRNGYYFGALRRVDGTGSAPGGASGGGCLRGAESAGRRATEGGDPAGIGGSVQPGPGCDGEDGVASSGLRLAIRDGADVGGGDPQHQGLRAGTCPCLTRISRCAAHGHA